MQRASGICKMNRDEALVFGLTLPSDQGALFENVDDRGHLRLASAQRRGKLLLVS